MSSPAPAKLAEVYQQLSHGPFLTYLLALTATQCLLLQKPHLWMTILFPFGGVTADLGSWSE